MGKAHHGPCRGNAEKKGSEKGTIHLHSAYHHSSVPANSYYCNFSLSSTNNSFFAIILLTIMSEHQQRDDHSSTCSDFEPIFGVPQTEEQLDVEVEPNVYNKEDDEQQTGNENDDEGGRSSATGDLNSSQQSVQQHIAAAEGNNMNLMTMLHLQVFSRDKIIRLKMTHTSTACQANVLLFKTILLDPQILNVSHEAYMNRLISAN